jgi:S-(hydroxymethyl)glutathione dehydrogenase/alcohol dehydrogenase
VPSVDVSMLGCSGACGLGTTLGVAPVTVGSDVVVLGCGPLGLAAIQGAKLKGASQIIAVDPIAARRAVAQQLGATTVLDPNVDTNNVVANIRALCKDPSDRLWAGGRPATQWGPDFVIEAVGGDVFPPKAEAGPDPSGILSLQWAWALCSASGHVATVSVGQKGTFTLPGAQWSNGAKNHHPGNFNGVSTLKDIQLFTRLIERGQFNARALGPDRYTLDRTKEALQAVADRTTVGAAIVFD